MLDITVQTTPKTAISIPVPLSGPNIIPVRAYFGRARMTLALRISRHLFRSIFSATGYFAGDL